MSATEVPINRPHFGQLYIWSLMAAGVVISLVSLYYLPFEKLDFRFLFLCLMVIASSFIAVPIPRVSGRITVADTFVFLGMLMYGGAAAIVLSALEGVAVTVIISKKPRVFLLNSAILATSTFFTATVLSLIFGAPASLAGKDFSARFFYAICLMGFVQYIANTTLISLEKAPKINESVWNTWRTYYLWTSVTYFAGASAAGIIAILINRYNFYAVFATAPIILIIWFTYQTYLKNIESSIEQTEAARLHVEELSKYIGELQRSEEARGQLLLRALLQIGRAHV